MLEQSLSNIDYLQKAHHSLTVYRNTMLHFRTVLRAISDSEITNKKKHKKYEKYATVKDYEKEIF